MLRELDIVRLRAAKPEHGLQRDATGTVVFVHNGGAAVQVEFRREGGKPAVVVLREEEVETARVVSAS